MIAALLAVMLGASALSAQALTGTGSARVEPSGASELERFVAAARAGTVRYRDQRVARDDGYRRIGPDFPGMGEHWVHVGLLLAGRLRPEAPSVLSYTMIGGRPELVGVAYALALPHDAPLPASPAPDEAWHEHGGSVDEESFLLDHGSDARSVAGERLIVMHAWIWEPNPRGMFATDNWSLPFRRAGRMSAIAPSSGAARALSLAGSGEAFHRRLFGAGISDDPAAGRRLDALLATQAARVRSVLETAADTLDEPRVRALETIWLDTWEALDGAVGPSAAARLRALHIRLEGTHAPR